jgi:membrane-associated phospholipid phosphatase
MMRANDLRRTRASLLASLMALVIAAGCYVVSDRTYLGQLFESSAYLGAERSRLHMGHPGSHRAHLLTVASFALAGLLLAAVAFRGRRPRLGMGLGITTGLSILFSESAKLWWLPRPVLGRTVTFAPGSASFPSGHVTTATAGALAFLLLTPSRWRSVAAVGSCIYVVAISTVVLAVPWHRPGDVIGGALIAFAGISAALPVFHRFGWLSKGGDAGVKSTMILIAGAAVIAACAAFWSALRIVFWLSKPYHHVATSATVPRQAFLDGWVATSSVLVLLFLAFLVLAGRSVSGSDDRALLAPGQASYEPSQLVPSRPIS